MNGQKSCTTPHEAEYFGILSIYFM